MTVSKRTSDRIPARHRLRPEAGPKPLIIAHRGASAFAPENTLAAFELAIKQGADGLEFDVHCSADGVPMVLHDASLDRTTNGHGRVAGHDLRSLKRLDAGSWFNLRHPAHARALYAGCHIPTLGEALELVMRRRTMAFIEIKASGERSATVKEGIERKVLDEVDRSGAKSHACVISFHTAALRRCREMDDGVSLGIDFTRPRLVFRLARMINARWLLPHWALASRRLMRRAHDAGLGVLVWGSENPRILGAHLRNGADGVVTGNPLLAQTVMIAAAKKKAGRG